MPAKKVTSNPYGIEDFRLPVPPTFSNDSEAWDAFRQGNESAFIFIYQSYFDVLYVYGFSIVSD